ncbi:unnamed protein product [Rhizoctonia solani]|uniref:F-box domain-containing protein n=1 Tax=Rhizoctonia solani TaxID=456999 RepID=A0A8H3I2N2_9AGAM|nr:unnamed protein product [Rhizoctonia solani]
MKSHKPASSALLKWENAGKKLATALSAYLQSCASLETLSTTQSVDYSDMPNRIQISLETLHPKLFDELSQSQVILARMNNKMSSRFNSLPNEILAEIFLDVVYNPGPDEARFPEMVDSIRRILGRLHCLLAVCSTWRNVAMDLGDLWTVIPVTDSRSSFPALEALSLGLQRARPSGERHLHLAAVLRDNGYDPSTLFNGIILSRLTTVNIEARSKRATSSVCSLLRRLLGSRPAPISEMSIHQYRDPEEKPPLRSLTDDQYFDFHMSQGEDMVFRDLMESLTVLRLKNVNLRWETITFSSRLVDLRLQSMVLGEHFILDDLPGVLQSAPELRNLEFISLIALPPTWDHPFPTAVTLPKLQTLLLADLFLNIFYYLRGSIAHGAYQTKVGLTRRNWTSLDSGLDTDGWDEEEPLNVDIRSVLRSSRIDTLILNQDNRELQWTNKETLSLILGSAPTLRSLAIIGSNWDMESIRAIERPTSDESFPHLDELYILDSYIEDADHLADVAASHLLRVLAVDGPNSLISTNVNHEDIIQRLGHVVPDLRFVGGSEQLDELNYQSWRLW